MMRVWVIIQIDESNYHVMSRVKGQLKVKYFIHHHSLDNDRMSLKNVSRGFCMVTNRMQ